MNIKRPDLFGFAIFFAVQPILLAGLILAPAKSAQAADPTTNQTVSDSLPDGGETDDVPSDANLPSLQIDNMQKLAWLYADDSRLEIAPQDRNKLTDYKVDTRVTDYLLYLVTPIEWGGAGFSHIKSQRIFKNYDTNGVGKFDRESASAVEEDSGIISTHNRGQAADISEVGQLTCKVVEHRRIGGHTTHFQAPKPVKVAWQSNEGIARHPTPKGPSLMEISGSMTAENILAMLNQSGEMDAYADFVKGLDLPTILTYVGANIYLKNLGSKEITSDPLSDSLIHLVGGTMLEKYLPDLPQGTIIGQNDDDVRVVLAKAKLEQALNLPPGSLRGYGWNEILKGTGKRTLENALGLPALWLDNHSLEETNKLDTVQAAITYLSRGDDAFNVPSGTLDKFRKNDPDALRLAGVTVLADALKLSADQRKSLEDAARTNKEIALNPNFFDSLPIDREINITDLNNLFSEKPDDQQKLKDSFKQIGLDLLNGALAKATKGQYDGLPQKLIDQLTNTKTIKLGEVKDTLGQNKLAMTTDQNPTANQTNNAALTAIADNINKDLALEGVNTVTTADVDNAVKNKNFDIFKKIGGFEADKTLGWQEGTGLAIISKQKSLNDGLKEMFNNAVGSILDLDPDSRLSLDGDPQANYGLVLIEQRLGMDKNTMNGKADATSLSPSVLSQYFSLHDSRSLADLRTDSGYWNNPDNVKAWESLDDSLSLPHGTIGEYLLGKRDTQSLAKKAASQSFTNLAVSDIWNYFDLQDTFRLNDKEANQLIDTLRNWDASSLDARHQLIDLAAKIAGRSVDSKADFSLDTFVLYAATGDTKQATQVLLKEGLYLFSGVLGLKLDKFDQDKQADLYKKLEKVFSGTASSGDTNAVIDAVLKTTGIPQSEIDDAHSFVKGDYRAALDHWSAAIWTDEANKYLPPDGRLSYQEVRNATYFDDTTAIDTTAYGLYKDARGDIPREVYNGLPDDQKQPLRDQARRKLMSGYRDSAQYKISDSLLIKAGILVPADFSKTMTEGSEQQRAELLLNLGFTYLDKALHDIDSGYDAGTLKRLFAGELSAADGDKLILSIINRSGVSFGSFDTGFVKNFYQFIRSSNKADFFTNKNYDGMWSYFDNWLTGQLRIGGLPDGLSKSVYFASQHNWDFNAGVKQGDQVIVSSLSQIGNQFLVERLSGWGDSNLKLPAGTMFRVYQAVKAVGSASQALALAHAGGGDVVAARAGLSKAQASLTVLAITIALNACAACQQFFSSIDQAIAAPPGFTNMLVAGAIAAAFGLGPAGLIAAAAYFFIGVSSVSYECPIPPPDNFALTTFDPPDDQLPYTWGDYYSQPGVSPIGKDTPSPGQSPWDWVKNDIKFADATPQLWQGWARYNTGRLLDATLKYGQMHPEVNKPKQIITYRQANVEYFTAQTDPLGLISRMLDAFGSFEPNNPTIGLGFSQTTTKTTDWVHVSFGGLF